MPQEFFGILEKVTSSIQNRRIALSGHVSDVFRDESLLEQQLIKITGGPDPVGVR